MASRSRASTNEKWRRCSSTWLSPDGRILVRSRVPETAVDRMEALFPGLSTADQLRRVLAAGLDALE